MPKFQEVIMAEKKFLPEIFEKPFSQMAQFPSMWSNFYERNFLPMIEEYTTRNVRMYEEGNELHVEVPLPGLNSNEIEVNLNKGTLWIKGESKQEEKDKNKKFYRSSKRSYSYSLTLPRQIDEKGEPHATYEDGILKVSMRLAKQDESKKIEIKSNKREDKDFENGKSRRKAK
jgi:HSP20 family protein